MRDIIVLALIVIVIVASSDRGLTVTIDGKSHTLALRR